MFIRGEGQTVSIQDASRRLQVPVDTLWKWITDGKLEADVRRGRGNGMEYYLEPRELNRARELREREYVMTNEEQEPATFHTPPDNVISVEFSEATAADAVGNGKPAHRRQAIAALEGLRVEAVAAIERQATREAAIGDLARAVQGVMQSMLEALDRARDANHDRITADLEALRRRLGKQLQDRERDDLRLRDELAATKKQLASALEKLHTGRPQVEVAAQTGPPERPETTAAEVKPAAATSAVEKPAIAVSENGPPSTA